MWSKDKNAAQDEMRCSGFTESEQIEIIAEKATAEKISGSSRY